MIVRRSPSRNRRAAVVRRGSPAQCREPAAQPAFGLGLVVVPGVEHQAPVCGFRRQAVERRRRALTAARSRMAVSSTARRNCSTKAMLSSQVSHCPAAQRSTRRSAASHAPTSAANLLLSATTTATAVTLAADALHRQARSGAGETPPPDQPLPHTGPGHGEASAGRRGHPTTRGGREGRHSTKWPGPTTFHWRVSRSSIEA